VRLWTWIQFNVPHQFSDPTCISGPENMTRRALHFRCNIFTHFGRIKTSFILERSTWRVAKFHSTLGGCRTVDARRRECSRYCLKLPQKN
jgi:hypothetical protein